MMYIIIEKDFLLVRLLSEEDYRRGRGEFEGSINKSNKESCCIKYIKNTRLIDEVL